MENTSLLFSSTNMGLDCKSTIAILAASTLLGCAKEAPKSYPENIPDPLMRAAVTCVIKNGGEIGFGLNNPLDDNPVDKSWKTLVAHATTPAELARGVRSSFSFELSEYSGGSPVRGYFAEYDDLLSSSAEPSASYPTKEGGVFNGLDGRERKREGERVMKVIAGLCPQSPAK